MVEMSPWPFNLVVCLFHAVAYRRGALFGTLLNHGMSGAMIQERGEIWTTETLFQLILPKSDRLPGQIAGQ